MTDEKKPGRKPQITVTPRTESAFNTDEIIAKRLSGDPHASGTQAIPMREPGRWAVRIANAELHQGRIYEMKARKGWVEFTAADLPEGITAESLGFQTNESGALCRGPRGQEIIFKQPMEANIAIQKAKVDKNRKGMGSAAAVKADLVNATGGAHGDEAASFASRNIHITGGDREGPLGA